MAELEAAGKRFDGAITRLEKALTDFSGPQGAAEWAHERAQLQAELESLKDNHVRVSAECAGLQQQNDALQRMTNAVSGGLDVAIGEIAEILRD